MKISAETFPPLRVLIVLGGQCNRQLRQISSGGESLWAEFSRLSRYQAHLDHKWERKHLAADKFKHTNPLLIGILHILATIMFLVIRENSITKRCTDRNVECTVFRGVRKIAKSDCWIYHVCMSIRRLAWNNSVPIGRIIVKFDFRVFFFFRKSAEKI